MIEYLPALVTATEIAKNLRELFKKDKKVSDEVIDEISDLMEKLTDARVAALALAENNSELHKELEDVKEEAKRALASFTDFEFRTGVYYRKGLEGAEAGPFCQVCWDRDKKPVRLHDERPSSNCWHCKVCKTPFDLPR
jgi:rubrerythrin